MKKKKLLWIGGIIVVIVFGAVIGLVVTASLEWHYYLSPMWTMIGMVVSIGTGVVAGLYPAWRATRVDPIDALRHE